MADVKGGFTKVMQKHAGRAKEKLLQSLGKSEKTIDELFEEHLNNFKKQETSANRLHKELKNYVVCVKALQAASKSLFDTLGEVYEAEWVGYDLIGGRTQTVELLWGDFCHKLNDQILGPLNIYQSQFPEVRRKVDKRGRKLVDYDSCRHNFEALQTSTKKKDDAKLVKTREQLDEAKRLYEHLNKDLHDELPALYDSRIPFLVSNFQSLFIAESVFHAETAKVNSELSEILDKLAEENQKGTYKRVSLVRSSSIPNSPKGSPVTPTKEAPDSGQYEEIEFNKEDHKKKLTNGDATVVTKENGLQNESNIPGAADSSPVTPVANFVSTTTTVTTTEEEEEATGENHVSSDKPESKKQEELYDIPVGATTDDLPPGVLYRVRATYKYEKEDDDELSFDVGEMIQVIEYEDPEDQEEGWLMGVVESSQLKGLFPANFTRPI
ncbi:hypothetical protein CHUAL_010332 [Chamberlinius hualienensis]